MLISPSCWATYRRPSGPNCSEVTRLEEAPVSLLLPKPTAWPEPHGWAPLRNSTWWASVGPVSPWAWPPAAMYTPPLQTAAWMPCRAVGMEASVRQVLLAVL